MTKSEKKRREQHERDIDEILGRKRGANAAARRQAKEAA